MAEKTQMTEEWMDRVWNENQPRLIPETGNVVMFGRGAFVNVIERSKDKAGVERSFGLVLLLPPKKEPTLLKNIAIEMFKEKAPAALTNKALMDKYHNPFKKQDTFIDKKTGHLYDGFVAGRNCMSFNSPSSKPACFDQRMNVIDDKKRCYSGAWMIVSVFPKWLKRDEKEGPNFYLQQVMIVADDEVLGGDGAGGSFNPQADFGGVKIDASVNPADAFGTGVTAGGETEDVDIFG